MKKNKLIVLCGPTASGKTQLAIRIAQHFNTSIISADSRQCYKEISIGTAKPSQEELDSVLHYFINTHSIHQEVNAKIFENYALHTLSTIFKTNNIAILCGGTGLYIKTLCEGIDDRPSIDKNIELQVKENYEQHGLTWLQNELQKQDKKLYENIDINNVYRLQRALVFILSTGESIIAYEKNKKIERDFDIEYYTISMEREELYPRINKRVDEMMKNGLLDEVQQVYNYKHLKSLQTVGYTELFAYIENKYSLEQAIDKIKQHTRNYAKRQMTWFRHQIVGYTGNDEFIFNKITKEY